MKLIKSDVIIKEQEEGLTGIYKQIEWAGRHCYKSLDKITEDSAKSFVDRMIASGHGAMLEHGTVYLYCKADENNNPLGDYFHNPYSKAIWIGQGKYADVYVTTNMRVLVEHNCLDDLKYLCEPTKYHEKRITVKFILSRSIAQEYTRHRVFSFAMESQRYCAYNKDKFGNEVTYILPCWWKDEEGDWAEAEFCNSLQYAEEQYFYLLKQGWKPQQAREVLPNACKTELVMTGFESDWKGFFKLRSPKAGATGVHPDAAYLADMLYDKLNNK